MEPELRELLDKQAIAELLFAFGEGIDRRDPECWRAFSPRTAGSIMAPSGNWWDAPGDPAKVGAYGPADPAWQFLDPRTAW